MKADTVQCRWTGGGGGLGGGVYVCVWGGLSGRCLSLERDGIKAFIAGCWTESWLDLKTARCLQEERQEVG